MAKFLEDFADYEAKFMSHKKTNLHLNIRSLDKHFEELQVMLRYLEDQFDVIVLAENWDFKYPGTYNVDDEPMEKWTRMTYSCMHQK